jgi:broad specificity phosphatase PhoE
MTTFVHLIRHAQAGDRERWRGPDEARPLTKGGRRQASRLAELFTDEPFVQLLSSPFARCVQTLEPLALARGLRIDTRDELSEGQPWEYVEKLVLEAEVAGPTAVCVHGDVMRELIQDLIERGVVGGGSGDVRKGSTWVLGVSDGAIISARHIGAPSGKSTQA